MRGAGGEGGTAEVATAVFVVAEEPVAMAATEVAATVAATEAATEAAATEAATEARGSAGRSRNSPYRADTAPEDRKAPAQSSRHHPRRCRCSHR